LNWEYLTISSDSLKSLSGFVTLGPLGSLLKRRIEDKFRSIFVNQLGILEIETSVIMPARVFEASGHVDHFKEPMVKCGDCGRRFRGDHLLQENAGLSDTETEKLSLQDLFNLINKNKIGCPNCGGEFNESRNFLTMFTTTIGPYSESTGYGRPEAAQGIFVEFKRLYEYAREKLPFGAVQIGRALRNEISPRQGPIRLREFTIIDLEFFLDPKKDQCPILNTVEREPLRLIPAEKKRGGDQESIEITVQTALDKGYIEAEWLAFFMALSKRFLVELGISNDKQRFIEKLEWERAHYSTQGYDQEVWLDRWGWVELSGHNYRADYDLKCHMESSGVDMRVFTAGEERIIVDDLIVKPVMSKIGPFFKENASEIVNQLAKVDPKDLVQSFKDNGLPVEKTGRRFIPHVIEPSFGSDRLVYATLEHSLKMKEGRTVLSLPRDISPIQLSVFPLVSKDGLPEKAEKIRQFLVGEDFIVEYDESGSIGRRYARADEIGIPLNITVDYETFENETVTLRDRDTWKQIRIEIKNLPALLEDYFRYKTDFEDLRDKD
jgi:glycyl-tRNA synthetase